MKHNIQLYNQKETIFINHLFVFMDLFLYLQSKNITIDEYTNYKYVYKNICKAI